MEQKSISILISFSLFLASILSPIFISQNISNAITNGECGETVHLANSAAAGQVPAAYVSGSIASTLSFNGKRFDVIGYNDNGVSKGIAGPNDSVTIILDAISMDTTKRNSKFGLTQSSAEYNGSLLQQNIETEYNSFSDKQGIIPRTLLASKSFYNQINGSSLDSVLGSSDIVNQYLWPLSSYEFINLKGSVRAWGEARNNADQYWLRNPATKSSSDTIQGVSIATMSDNPSVVGLLQIEGGILPNDNYGAGIRYAMYISMSKYKSLTSLNNPPEYIGACTVNPTININGYTFEIVGINKNNQVEGFSTTPNNAATLILSTKSNKKFAYPNENTTYKNTIFGRVSVNGEDFEYGTTNLKQAMESAYLSLGAAAQTDILSRTLTGGSGACRTLPAHTTSDNTNCVTDGTYKNDNIAGNNVDNAKLWPLSLKEVNDELGYNTRIFGLDYWLRTPGHKYTQDDDEQMSFVAPRGAAIQFGALSNNSGKALRPAMYFKLNNEIENAWNNRNNNWNQDINFEPSKSTPNLNQYDINGIGSFVYNGSSYSITVSPKTAQDPNVTSIYYEGINGTDYWKSLTPPTNIGNYQVTFSTAETNSYSASDQNAGILKITKKLITPIFAWSYWTNDPATDGESREFDGTKNAISNSGFTISNFSQEFSLDNVIGLEGSDSLKIYQGKIGSGQIYNENRKSIDSSYGCAYLVFKRSKSPMMDLLNPNVGKQSLEILIQKNKNSGCNSFWDKYDFSNDKIEGLDEVYSYSLSNAIEITKNTSSTLTLQANDITMTKDGTISDFSLRAISGTLQNDLSQTNPYLDITGSLDYQNCSTINLGTQSNCIEQGDIEPINYQNFEYIPGSVNVIEQEVSDSQDPTDSSGTNDTTDSSATVDQTDSSGTIDTTDSSGTIDTTDSSSSVDSTDSSSSSETVDPTESTDPTISEIPLPPLPKTIALRTIFNKINLVVKKSIILPIVQDTLEGISKLTYISSNPKIAKVDSKGKITGKKIGKVSISIIAQNGITKKIQVNIVKKPVPLKSLKVQVTKKIKINTSNSIKLIPNTKKFTIDKISFKSSNTKNMKVDKVGKITVIKRGTYKITVKFGKMKVVVKIKVV